VTRLIPSTILFRHRERKDAWRADRPAGGEPRSAPGRLSGKLNIPRPSHADYAYEVKIWHPRIERRGGRARGRRSAAWRPAAIADKILAEKFGIKIVAWVQFGWRGGRGRTCPNGRFTRAEVDRTLVRCPESAAAASMEEAIAAARAANDSVEESLLASAGTCRLAGASRCSISWRPSLRRRCCRFQPPKVSRSDPVSPARASEAPIHNDLFLKKGDGLGTVTNRAAGVQGGNFERHADRLSRGLQSRPPPSVLRRRPLISTGTVVLEAKGRHDPCVVPRAVPIVEAMTALVLADFALLRNARKE